MTGFKWMGNLAFDLMTQGKTVLFSFEEAIGKVIQDYTSRFGSTEKCCEWVGWLVSWTASLSVGLARRQVGGKVGRCLVWSVL